MSVKKIVGKIHLWLGLASGLVVFVVSLTGCLYAFQWEIRELTEGFRHVERRDEPFLPPSVLRTIAERELPGRKVHAVQYEGKGRAAAVSFYDYEPEYYYLVYIDQYSGDVLKVKNMYTDFFYLVLQGHYYLWLPADVGQPVVATATLIFVVMLITGMVLWWPKKKRRKQRFSIRWNARWRRRNYDLHNVLGFYVMAIALVLGLTGLVWGFAWFGNSVYRIAGGDKVALYEEPPSAMQRAVMTPQPIDELWLRLENENPGADVLEVHFPEDDTASVAVTINPDRFTYWKSDYRFYDQYTLEEIPVDQVYGRLDNASGADTLMRMNYDIHTGAILGLPGKILAFFASLICASLPVTGFCIWYGRKYKKPSHERVATSVEASTEIPQEV
jgi:uncharacterized iron-regulated membrane protein